MIKAPETPCANAGGGCRNKTGEPGRIRPREIPRKRVSAATGCLSILLATPCIAQETNPSWNLSVPTMTTPAQASSAQAAPNMRRVTPPSTTTQAQGANPAAPQANQAKDALTATDSAHPPEKKFPPPVSLLSPSASLDRKSKVSIGLVKKWQGKNIKPTMGPRGEVRFIYGATQDTVIGSPNHVSDIALQPGEIVQNINLGDPTMWSCPPAISGTGANEITHLMCKPADAGLETNIGIQTSRRTYSIELRSTRANYMPRVSWSYPEDQAAQWAAYQQGRGQQGQQLPLGGAVHYAITGDHPSWTPFAVFSDGTKTYLRFPPAMAYGQAPVLERLPAPQ